MFVYTNEVCRSAASLCANLCANLYVAGPGLALVARIIMCCVVRGGGVWAGSLMSDAAMGSQ